MFAFIASRTDLDLLSFVLGKWPTKFCSSFLRTYSLQWKKCEVCSDGKQSSYEYIHKSDKLSSDCPIDTIQSLASIHYQVTWLHWRKWVYFGIFIALVGKMHLILQDPIVDINSTEKCNYTGEKKRIFYLSNNYFSSRRQALIIYICNFSEESERIFCFFAHPQ